MGRMAGRTGESHHHTEGEVMDKSNPAVFECRNGRARLHTWKRNEDGTATCALCNLSLTKQQADEVFATGEAM